MDRGAAPCINGLGAVAEIEQPDMKGKVWARPRNKGKFGGE